MVTADSQNDLLHESWLLVISNGKQPPHKMANGQPKY